MKHFIYILFFLFIVDALMTSCRKEKNFSPIPAIIFDKYVSYGRDSAYCYIKFKDGDGDIGGDTIPDLMMKYLFKLKSTDVAFLPYNDSLGTGKFDTLFYPYRVSNITPAGQYKALDGEITIKLRTQPLYSPGAKVVKFEITLTDRAGHKSNMVETNEITVP